MGEKAQIEHFLHTFPRFTSCEQTTIGEFDNVYATLFL